MLSGVFGFAAIVGPSLGAFLVEAGDWRTVFWVNLPISAAAIAMLMAFLHETRAPRRHQIDYPGTILLAVAISAIIFAADRGREIGLPKALIAIAVGVMAFGGPAAPRSSGPGNRSCRWNCGASGSSPSAAWVASLSAPPS